MAARTAAHSLSDPLDRHRHPDHWRTARGSAGRRLGDKHEIFQTNQYQNPFWNTIGFFKTSGGHSSRISVFWHVAAGGTERGAVYGDLMSFIMARPEGSPNTVVTISKDGRTVIDDNGYPEGDVT
jgi:hypothetical protein